MKYVKCKFRETDTRTYTYTWAGADTLTPGDKVQVAAPREERLITIIVVAVTDTAPPFKCKPIKGLAPPKPTTEEGEI